MIEEYVQDMNDFMKDVPILCIANACKKLQDPFSEFINYMPTPMQFKRLCYPSEYDLKIPSLEKAYNYSLCHVNIKNNFLSEIFKIIDYRYDFLNVPKKDSMYSFKRAYTVVKEHFIRNSINVDNFLSEEPIKIEHRFQSEQEKNQIDENQRLIALGYVNKMYNILGAKNKALGEDFS